LAPRQSCTPGGAGTKAGSDSERGAARWKKLDSKQIRTLGKAALKEKLDPRWSCALRKVTLDVQLDPSRIDYREAHLELAPSRKVSTYCARIVETEIVRPGSIELSKQETLPGSLESEQNCSFPKVG
jgi:hypothetical protein